MATDQISSARLRLAPLKVADAAEMVDVLSGEALYAYTGGAPPGLDELRARYALQAAGRSADGREEWCNWILRRKPGGEAVGYVQATITSEHWAGGPAYRDALPLLVGLIALALSRRAPVESFE